MHITVLKGDHLSPQLTPVYAFYRNSTAFEIVDLILWSGIKVVHFVKEIVKAFSFSYRPTISSLLGSKNAIL